MGRSSNGGSDGGRVKAACTNCKKAKARCDRGRPCSRCVERGYDECVDAFPRRVGRRRNHFFDRIVTEHEVQAVQARPAKKTPKSTKRRGKRRDRERPGRQAVIKRPKRGHSKQAKRNPGLKKPERISASNTTKDSKKPENKSPDHRPDLHPELQPDVETESDKDDIKRQSVSTFEHRVPQLETPATTFASRMKKMPKLDLDFPSLLPMGTAKLTDAELNLYSESSDAAPQPEVSQLPWQPLRMPMVNLSVSASPLLDASCDSSSCSDFLFDKGSGADIGLISDSVPQLDSFGSQTDIFGFGLAQDTPVAY